MAIVNAHPAMSDMPTLAESTAVEPALAQPEFQLRRISVTDYHRMAKANIFAPDERVELLDGVLIAVPPGGPNHVYGVDQLAQAFFSRFSGRARISIKGAMALDEWSEPEPDLMLLALPGERYAVAHPQPPDVLLVVEVAASSLRFDSGRKLRAYARRGVREYWIVDLAHERIEVFRDPNGELYRSHRTLERGSSVAPAAFPDVAIAVDEVLPPPAR